MDLPVEKLSSMTPEQERLFWEQFERDLDSDTGEAAQAHLAAGHPIYYGDPAYPGHVVKQYPDGRRQLVDFDLKTGVETIIQSCKHVQLWVVAGPNGAGKSTLAKIS